MLRINHSEDRELIAQAVGKKAHAIDPVIVRAEEDICIGGFLFTSFTGKGGSIWASAAGFREQWLNRDLLRYGFGYVFNQLECRSVFARIAEDNQKSLDFCGHLGFNRQTKLADVFPDGRGQWIFRMRRHECRWLPQVFPIHATVH